MTMSVLKLVPSRLFCICGIVLLAFSHGFSCNAWAPSSSLKKTARLAHGATRLYVKKGTPSFVSEKNSNESEEEKNVSLASQVKPESLMASALVPLALLMFPENAHAAGSPSVIGSAFVAYGHYLSLLVTAACITTERFTIKPNMTGEEEDRIAIADTVLGLAGVLLAYTGYLRVVEYGKGWEFYAHEPIFWLKIAFVGVFGGLSFFNTIIIIQLSVAKRQGETLEPMSEKLADRMNRICTAELSALASIPLTATLMSRGVLYSDEIPWQIGAGFAFLVFGGASYKYVSDALNWKEDLDEIETSAES